MYLGVVTQDVEIINSKRLSLEGFWIVSDGFLRKLVMKPTHMYVQTPVLELWCRKDIHLDNLTTWPQSAMSLDLHGINFPQAPATTWNAMVLWLTFCVLHVSLWAEIIHRYPWPQGQKAILDWSQNITSEFLFLTYWSRHYSSLKILVYIVCRLSTKFQQNINNRNIQRLKKIPEAVKMPFTFSISLNKK